PDVQLNRFHTPSLFLGSSECEAKWSKLTCYSWMIRQLLREGAMYELSEFEMTRCNNHSKFCDSYVAIQFKDLTKFIENPYSSYIFGQLIPASFALSEIIGERHHDNIQWPEPDRLHNLAELLHNRLETGVRQPTVMIATSINQKLCSTNKNDSTSDTKYGGVKKPETVSLPDLKLRADGATSHLLSVLKNSSVVSPSHALHVLTQVLLEL
ncbi:LOW QUALITY PROTEIN: hypothetical protein HID58_048667, partial [Brassica napus]